MSSNDFEAARLLVRLGAVEANFRACRRLAGPAAVAAVVKADAYGLGMAQIAQRLARTGCDTFFVARLEEGIALRAVAPQSRIFVLDGAPPDAVPALIRHALTPVLNSLADIAAWGAAAEAIRSELDAAIHFDTGMNRLGLSPEDLSLLAAEHAGRLAGLRVVLWVSHLACADDPQAAMNRVQLERFRSGLAMLPAAPASFSSSGGILLGRDYAFDMVRPGLGLYGGNPQPLRPNPFKNVAELTGRILQLRRIAVDETVGYGATFRARRPTLLATAALGYKDGLMRALTAKGFGAIGGVRVPVAGRVSMDLITLDVTDVPVEHLAPGVPVEFLGDTITLEEIAAACGTASYEILTSLSRRAARHFED
ncbi:MAG: alanine racemase [Alphaproteobacteria bacterium]|nr:alanine racemase [Alphaproteobacteria bacterium]MBV9693838.1 alanine racemase [Alphaproteobacteria bacterium]